MFVVDVPPFAYEDPWMAPLPERLQQLLRRSTRILYLYEAADNSTFRYRVFNMQEVWNQGDGASASFFFYHDLPYLLMNPPRVDVIVICRCRYNKDLADFVSIQRQLGARIYYDIDDYVFSPRQVHLLINTLAQDLAHPGIWDFWHAYTSRMHEAMRLADGAITTNRYLAARIESELGIPVVVAPNALNRFQLDASDSIYDQKLQRGFERAVNFQIGYFSGSPSHEKDFDIVETALASVLANHPKVTVRIVGYLQDRPSLAPYRSRIEYYPFHDFVNLQRIVGFADLNIVPLHENIFTNCKSDLKYFEAAVVGTPTLATPIYSYSSAIQHDGNGYLAQAHEWSEQLDRIVSQPDAGAAVARRAHDQARHHYSPRAQEQTVQDAFFGASGLETLSTSRRSG